MFTEIIGKIDALRGQENIQPHELLDTLKDAFGQCQAFLQQRGPVEIGINGSEHELRGQTGYKLPAKKHLGAASQSDLSGYGSDYSFPPMWGASYGYPPMFVNPSTNEWNKDDVFGTLLVHNNFSYYTLPDNWLLGVDARLGYITNALNTFFQGVNVFSPINIHNNHQHNNNQVTILNHGDTVTRNLYVSNDTYINNNVEIDGDVTIEGDITVTNLTVTNITIDGDLDLTGIAGYSAGVVQVLGHAAGGTLTWYNTEVCT